MVGGVCRDKKYNKSNTCPTRSVVALVLLSLLPQDREKVSVVQKAPNKTAFRDYPTLGVRLNFLPSSVTVLKLHRKGDLGSPKQDSVPLLWIR